MRLAFATLVAAALGVTDHGDVDELDTGLTHEMEVDEKPKQEEQAQMLMEVVKAHQAKMGADRTKAEKGLKEVQETASALKVSDDHLAAMAKASQESSQSREERTRTMKKEEAFDMLKGKMPEEDRQQVMSLASTDKKAAIPKRIKKLFIKAQQTLNDMWIATDNMRAKHIMTCHNEIYNKYKNMRSYYESIHAIVAMYSAARKTIVESDQLIDQIIEEEALPEFFKFWTMLKEQWAIRWQKRKELYVAREDALVFRFIMWQVSPKCDKKTGKMNTKVFAQQSSEMATQRCQEQCMNDETATNTILASVFADPEIKKLAKYELSAEGNEKMEVTEKHLKEAESDWAHVKYSFLQTKTARHPKLPNNYKITNEPGCGCEGGQMDCKGVLVLVGQELECKKEIVRQKRNDYIQTWLAHREERMLQYQVLMSIHSRIMNYERLKGDADKEMMNLLPLYQTDVQKFREAERDLHIYRFKCITTLQDIDQNQFCGIDFVRKYMKMLLMYFLKVKGEDVIDCKLADEYTNDGDCEDDKGVKQECVPGEELPDADKFTYRQNWIREAIVEAKQSEAGDKKLDGESIVLQCPAELRTLRLPCNYFLCPIECVVGKWTEFSGCTKTCDTGEEVRTRVVDVYPKYGGGKCPDLQEVRECGTDPCDVPCVLHQADEIEGPAGGCLQACLHDMPTMVYNPSADEPGSACDLGYRCRVARRHILEDAIGKGECPEKNSEARYAEVPCEFAETKMCNGDEMCNEKMDLALAYECSIATGRLGCYYIASFVTMLLHRMPPESFGYGTMQVALIWFGNGRSIQQGKFNKKGRGNVYYTVADAYALPSHENPIEEKKGEMLYLASDVYSMVPKVFQETFKMWAPKGNPNFTIGFNNAAQALSKAKSILDDESRVDAQSKKMLFVTTGVRSDCTKWSSLANNAKDKGYVIDVVLFAKNVDDLTDPEKYKDIQMGVTYPPKVHFMKPGVMEEISDKAGRLDIAQRVIPTICPGAASPTRLFKSMCDEKVLLVHRGRTCHNWTDSLSDESVTLSECRALAREGDFLSFIYTFPKHHFLADVGNDKSPVALRMDPLLMDAPGAFHNGPNCYVHPEDAKIDPVDDKGKPVDGTCKFVPDYGKEKADDYKGWMRQPLAPGEGDQTNHYKVLDSEEDCPKIEGEWQDSDVIKSAFPMKHKSIPIAA